MLHAETQSRARNSKPRLSSSRPATFWSGKRAHLINALKGHLTEYGWVAPKGLFHMAMLGDLLEDEMGSLLPPAAVAMFRMMLDLLADLDDCIAELEREIARRAREDEMARRLMTIPGIDPITATALIALALAAEPFAKGRDFAAWLQGASTVGTRPRMGLSKPDH